MADPILIYTLAEGKLTSNCETTSTGGWAGTFSEIATNSGGSWDIDTYSSNSRIEVSTIPYDGVKIYIGGSQPAAVNGVILHIKDVSGSKMISLSMVNSNITNSNDDLLVFSNEVPWPDKFSSSSGQTFQLTACTYGYQASIKSGSTWVPIISLIFKNPATNYLTSSTKTYFKQKTNYCGIKMPGGGTKYLYSFDAYKLASFGNSPSASYYSETYTMFYDDFSRTENPYNPNNATVLTQSSEAKTSTNGFYSAGTNVSNFSLSSNQLQFNTPTYSEILKPGQISTSAVNANYFPSADEAPVMAIKFKYISGPVVLDISDGVVNSSQAFAIFFNSSISGSMRPVTVRTYTSTTSKSGTTWSASYDVVGIAPGTATVPNTSNTTIASGSTVWVVSYPKLSGYTPTSQEYRIGVYVQDTLPRYGQVPTLRANATFNKKIFSSVGFFALSGAACAIDELSVVSLDIEDFGNPSSSTTNTTTSVNSGVPIPTTNVINTKFNIKSINTSFETQTTELTASTYLGNDFVYNTSEVIS
jgi:hypothetical protein